MKAARRAAEKSAEVHQFIWKHKQGFLIAIALFLMVSIFLNGMSSCSMLAEGVMSVLGGSTHPSSDEAMLGAEAAYTGMENELQSIWTAMRVPMTMTSTAMTWMRSAMTPMC